MAQKTDAQLTTEANIIRDETAIGANTALRVGIMLDNLIDSKTNNDVISDAPLGTSTSIVPTQNAVKTYADGLVVGLLDDRGNFDASTVGSPYPTLNGSGTGSIIQKGDIYFISVAGTVGTTSVAIGASVRALVDTPAQTSANWDVLDAGVGVVFEPAANKSDATNLGGVSPSHTLFPTQYAVKSYVDGTITPTPNLQAVLAAGNNLANGRNFQGTGAGGSNLGFNVNAFGTNSAVGNSGTNVNSFGVDASSGNTGGDINALGSGAAYDNAGSNVNALGYVAAKNNTGNGVNAFGYTAGYNNTHSSVNIFGFAASATADSQLAMTNEDGRHARIQYSGFTDDRLYELPDASGTLALLSDIPTSSGWQLTGNAGTTPGTDFIGTTDAKDVIFKANGVQRLRIDNVYGDIYTPGSFRASGSGDTSVQATGSNGVAMIAQDATSKGYLYLGNGGAGDVQIQCNNLTGSRIHQLPDADGTIALTSDIVASYKVYTALLNFDGSTVSAIVLQNTLGMALNWTNPANGYFRGIAVSGTPFTSDKTWINVHNYNNAGQPYIPTAQPRNLFPTTTIDILMYFYDGTLSGTPNVTNLPIEIRVYP